MRLGTMIVMPSAVNNVCPIFTSRRRDDVDFPCAPHTLAQIVTHPSLLALNILRLRRAARLGPMVLGVAACAHAGSTTADVPIAYGRWRPPPGQACYADAFQPRELPPLSALLDSAAVASELRRRPDGSVLIALGFEASGRTVRARVIDRRMPLTTADSIRALVEQHLRAPRSEESWGARLHASTGESASLALGRREVCPPVLARIEPLAFANVTIDEREPDAFPSPDWIIRGDVPPAARPRSAVERTVANVPVRDSARLAVDSVSTAPDVTAIGDAVLTLRVLIDTTGAIAHAEISRVAAVSVDRERLVAELARYRFYPALEDRVPTPFWVILKIK
jgi:hypothetical protein